MLFSSCLHPDILTHFTVSHVTVSMDRVLIWFLLQCSRYNLKGFNSKPCSKQTPGHMMSFPVLKLKACHLAYTSLVYVKWAGFSLITSTQNRPLPVSTWKHFRTGVAVLCDTRELDGELCAPRALTLRQLRAADMVCLVMTGINKE